MEALLSFDIHLFGLINREWTSSALDTWCLVWTEIGHYSWAFIFAVPLIYFLGSPKTRRLMIVFVPLVFLADALSSRLLQPWFERTRPFLVFPETRLLIEPQNVSLYGFPSTHAVNTFTGAVLLCLTYPRLPVIASCLFIAILTAYSRVYAGVHYPLDVAAGACIGTALGSLARLGMWWKWERKR